MLLSRFGCNECGVHSDSKNFFFFFDASGGNERDQTIEKTIDHVESSIGDGRWTSGEKIITKKKNE